MELNHPRILFMLMLFAAVVAMISALQRSVVSIQEPT